MLRSYFTTHVVHQNATVVRVTFSRQQIQTQCNGTGAVTELHTGWSTKITRMNSTRVRTIKLYFYVHYACFTGGRHLWQELRWCAIFGGCHLIQLKEKDKRGVVNILIAIFKYFQIRNKKTNVIKSHHHVMNRMSFKSCIQFHENISRLHSTCAVQVILIDFINNKLLQASTHTIADRLP